MVKEKNNYIYILQLKLFIHTELQVLLYKSRYKLLSLGCCCWWWKVLAGGEPRARHLEWGAVRRAGEVGATRWEGEAHWNRRGRLAGTEVGGSLEQKGEAHWNRRGRLAGTGGGGSLEQKGEACWNRRGRLAGTGGGGLLEQEGVAGTGRSLAGGGGLLEQERAGG